MKEHAAIRHHLGVIRNALEEYVDGDERTAETIALEFAEVINLYSKNIKKEDDPFFPAAMSMLTEEEKEMMKEAIMEFDRTFVIKRYESLIADSVTDITK